MPGGQLQNTPERLDDGGYAAVATRADEAMWRKSLASSELRKFTHLIELRLVVSTTTAYSIY